MSMYGGYGGYGGYGYGYSPYGYGGHHRGMYAFLGGTFFLFSCVHLEPYSPKNSDNFMDSFQDNKEIGTFLDIFGQKKYPNRLFV